MKLELEQMHLLRLAAKGTKEDGWAPVSKSIWPFMKNIPVDLLDREETENGGRCRITEEGRIVLKWS